MTDGELKDAERRALNILDKWNDRTGVVSRGGSYYYELQGVIEDAVRCGAQAACGEQEPSYTSAQLALTDAQIKGLIEEDVFFGNCKEIVRAIEAAHGIGIKGGQQ